MLVYALKDPRTGEIRYIGKTVKSLDSRVKAHMWKSQLKKPYYRSYWLRELAAEGLWPVAEVVMACSTEAELNAAEIFCIGFARGIGLPLTNGTDGGDGTTGWHPSMEMRAKMSAARRRRVTTAETRVKMSAARKGVPKSLETRRKMAEANRRRVLSRAKPA